MQTKKDIGVQYDAGPDDVYFHYTTVSPNSIFLCYAKLKEVLTDGLDDVALYVGRSLLWFMRRSLRRVAILPEYTVLSQVH